MHYLSYKKRALALRIPGTRYILIHTREREGTSFDQGRGRSPLPDGRFYLIKNLTLSKLFCSHFSPNSQKYILRKRDILFSLREQKKRLEARDINSSSSSSSSGRTINLWYQSTSLPRHPAQLRLLAAAQPPFMPSASNVVMRTVLTSLLCTAGFRVRTQGPAVDTTSTKLLLVDGTAV